MKFILGKKLGMTQIFNNQGQVIPVTLVKAGPCPVVQIKTQAKDGYDSVQIGFEKLKEKSVKKPQKGHFKKADLKDNFRYLREFKDSHLKMGDRVDVSIFNPGEIVRVSGISKGKGFQGVVKRHGFKGSPASHGTKHTLRAPGSIGSAFPQRVFKGKKMAGRMGSDKISVKGLEIIEIDQKDNLLAIKGALPGRKGTLLEIITTKEIAKVEKEEPKEAEKKEEPEQDK
ncbi:MAG: 50S ribosomal protein L3 [Parcubacteria group bacterium]|jgi:large subunit ribosomal protein L3|nr:50S ribosomal protein L3 [Parcubacteria group bacterium]|tara:strand:+ start:8076 stop:8759 length:684 start_codon:yes stop_codon:yes gene_type:complete